jgi:hypothetical protein
MKSRCWFFHRWSKWTTTNTARLAEVAGIKGVTRLRYRLCERCGTSEVK